MTQVHSFSRSILLTVLASFFIASVAPQPVRANEDKVKAIGCLFLLGCIFTYYGVTSCQQNKKFDKLEPVAAHVDERTGALVQSFPSNFNIEKKVVSWGSDFVINDGSKHYGTISEKVMSWTTTFKYTDKTGNVLASAKERFFAWGSTVDVVDGAGRKIGTIKEKIWKSLFKFYTEYEILDDQDHLVATSEKTEGFTTDFRIFDKSGRLVARMHRPFINFPDDKWEVSLDVSNKSVDSRLVAMIAAYKSAKDADRASSDSSDSSSSSKKK